MKKADIYMDQVPSYLEQNLDELNFTDDVYTNGVDEFYVNKNIIVFVERIKKCICFIKMANWSKRGKVCCAVFEAASPAMKKNKSFNKPVFIYDGSIIDTYRVFCGVKDDDANASMEKVSIVSLV